MFRSLTITLWLAFCACGHAASLDFKQTLREVHAAADAKSVTADFEFTNRSDQTVEVAKYDAACSCMAVTISGGKLRYKPGESGVVRAVFEMGNFSGTVDKQVALWLDKDPEDKPSITLKVRVHIPVLVALEPKTLNWPLGGEATPQAIRVTMHHDKPIRISSVKCSSGAFTHELKTIEEGKTYDLIVTPNKIGTPGIAILRIETDCDIARHRLQQAFAVVRKPAPGETNAAKP